MKFDSSNYDPLAVPDAVPEMVPYLIYRFPLQRSLQIRLDSEFAEDLQGLKSSDIFVVHFYSLANFVRTITTYF